MVDFTCAQRAIELACGVSEAESFCKGLSDLAYPSCLSVLFGIGSILSETIHLSLLPSITNTSFYHSALLQQSRCWSVTPCILGMDRGQVAWIHSVEYNFDCRIADLAVSFSHCPGLCLAFRNPASELFWKQVIRAYRKAGPSSVFVVHEKCLS